MPLRRITKEDDPITIQKLAKRYEELISQALLVAATRVKRKRRGVREMVSAAFLEGSVPGYKSISVGFPIPDSKSRWYVLYPWSHLEGFDVDEMADYIIDTVKRYVDDKRNKP